MLLRQSTSPLPQEHLTAEIAAKIEFLATAEVAHSSGMKRISELQAFYEEICKENGIEKPTSNRKSLKELIGN